MIEIEKERIRAGRAISDSILASYTLRGTWLTDIDLGKSPGRASQSACSGVIQEVVRITRVAVDGRGTRIAWRLTSDTGGVNIIIETRVTSSHTLVPEEEIIRGITRSTVRERHTACHTIIDALLAYTIYSQVSGLSASQHTGTV